jgi:methyl-accepting chemotaxis protein
MESGHFSFNINKVHKLNLLITIFMVALIIIPLVYQHGFAGSKLYILAGFFVIGCSLLNFFIKIPYILKAVLFAALPGTIKWLSKIVQKQKKLFLLYTRKINY